MEHCPMMNSSVQCVSRILKWDAYAAQNAIAPVFLLHKLEVCSLDDSYI